MRQSGRITSPRTLAAGSSGSPDWKYLSARRLALFITASIERGTRWLMFEQNAGRARQRAQAQVEAFLESARRSGRIRWLDA